MFEEAAPAFKPIQIPCEIKKDFIFVYCLTPDEFHFLRNFGSSPTLTCPKKQRASFEFTDLSDLVEKGILAIKEGAVDIYYSLTSAGRMLLETLKSI